MEKLQQKCHKKPEKRGLRGILSKYFNSESAAAKKLYKKAKEDSAYLKRFLAEFSKLREKEREKLYRMIDNDFEHCTRMRKNCDIIEPEARNVIHIFIESSDEKDRERIRNGVYETMKEIVFSGNGSGRPMASREFALEVMVENDLKSKETCEGVFGLKNDTELKNHALDCILESERFLVEEKETLMREFTDDLDYAVERILDGKPHEKEGELVALVILKRLANAGNENEANETGATLANLLCNENIKTRELVAMGLEEQIKKGNSFALNVTTEILIKCIAEPMLADSDFDLNLDGAEILYSLRFLPEARKMIRDDAIPDFNDMANDSRLSMEKRKAATVMLKKLTSV